MALTLGDNFSYQGAKPLDARLKYETVAAMKAVADATMYDGCLAYCAGTDKTYQWKSGNTIDETLGKWREFQAGGGGGGETYTAGDGIDISVENEISTKKSQSGWMDEVIEKVPMSGSLVNIANAFNRSDLYSETEKIVGQWIDGKPLYQKVIPYDSTITVSSTRVEPYIADITDLNIETSIYCQAAFKWGSTNFKVTPFVHEVSGGDISVVVDTVSDGNTFKVQLIGKRPSGSTDITNLKIILQYTKTTDSVVSIGSENEYSTDEKIIGSWVDGSPIYQRTYDLVTDLVVGYDTTWTMTSINSTNIDKVINCLATNSTGTFFPMMAYADRTQNVIGLTACRYGRTATVRHLTLQYTKLT